MTIRPTAGIEGLHQHAQEMLRRLANQTHLKNEPAYSAQIAILEQSVRVLVEALASSGVTLPVGAEVIEKYLLGMLPSDAQAQLSTSLINNLTEQTKNLPVGVVPPRLTEVFRGAATDAREGRADS